MITLPESIETFSEFAMAWLTLVSISRFFSTLRPAAICDTVVRAAAGGGKIKHSKISEVQSALGPEGFLVNVGRGSFVDADLLASA